MAINTNELVTVRNLCGWNIYFRLENSENDGNVPANGTRNLFVSEIMSQVNNNNVFFTGTNDGYGSHAKIYIENAEIREHFKFDRPEENETQKILTDEKCEYILGLKTQSAFEKNIREFVVENHELDKIMRYARKKKLDSFERIDFLERFTGLKYKE